MIRNRYKLLGSEDCPIVCDFCGKRHVSRYWAVEDVTSGEIIRCGSVCIRKALSVTVKEFNDGIREAVGTTLERYRPLLHLSLIHI